MTRKDVHLVIAGQVGKRLVTVCGLAGMLPHRVTTDYQRASCPNCRKKGKVA